MTSVEPWDCGRVGKNRYQVGTYVVGGGGRGGKKGEEGRERWADNSSTVTTVAQSTLYSLTACKVVMVCHIPHCRQK